MVELLRRPRFGIGSSGGGAKGAGIWPRAVALQLKGRSLLE
jgi:hypothetical protein